MLPWLLRLRPSCVPVLRLNRFWLEICRRSRFGAIGIRADASQIVYGGPNVKLLLPS